MAARWQQWMPLHIDRFRGSPDVQAMHPAARCGYLYLLVSAWQSDDCSLPDDDIDLAAASGLGDELWAVYALRIRRKFTSDNGRLVNAALRAEWEEAQSVFDKRSAAAKNTNKLRGYGEPRGAQGKNPERMTEAASAAERQESDAECDGGRYGDRSGEYDGHLFDERHVHRGGGRNAQPTVTEGQALRSPGTQTETLTGTEKTLKPSRAEREGESRHVSFRLAVQAYAKHMHVLFVWDASAGKQLDLLLRAAPELTLASFQACLLNRARSPGVPHGEHPRVWLPRILKYQQGPLNAFGRREEEGNGRTFQTKTGGSIDSAREAIRIIREREVGADCDPAGEARNSPAGEAGHRGLPGSG